MKLLDVSAFNLLGGKLNLIFRQLNFAIRAAEMSDSSVTVCVLMPKHLVGNLGGIEIGV